MHVFWSHRFLFPYFRLCVFQIMGLCLYKKKAVHCVDLTSCVIRNTQWCWVHWFQQNTAGRHADVKYVLLELWFTLAKAETFFFNLLKANARKAITAKEVVWNSGLRQVLAWSLCTCWAWFYSRRFFLALLCFLYKCLFSLLNLNKTPGICYLFWAFCIWILIV